MRRAYARQPPRHDLAALGHELPQQPIVLVVDVFDFLGAELAHLLATEELPSARAFPPRPAGPAPAAAESWTISARPSFRPSFRPSCLLLWCFCLLCHNSPRFR